MSVTPDIDAARYRRVLATILIADFLLRAYLAISGGQNFWMDEIRYVSSQKAVSALWQGEFRHFLGELHTADHFLFKIIGVIPAAAEKMLGPSAMIPALFFSLFSILNLWLVGGIVRRLGESRRTAIFSVVALSLCSTFFYYSRHLLPYDTAMSIGLLALFTGLHSPARKRDSILCGFLAACAFLTYNGYWTIAAFAVLFHCLHKVQSVVGLARRMVISGAGFTFPILGVFFASWMVGGNLLKKSIAFSATVTQGSYNEGWSLPWHYFWDAEHGLLLLWGVATIFILREFIRGMRRSAVVLALSGVCFVYSSLVFFSVLLEKFVVYGRLARQMVPFFCIAVALLLESVWVTRPRLRPLVVIVVVAAIFQAGANFRVPFSQVFPDEFRRMAAKVSLGRDSSSVRILNDYLIYPSPLPEGHYVGVLLSRPHPLQFFPYQYEGYTLAQRLEFRRTDISMKLVEVFQK